jgi:hypothetical protein
MPAVLADAFSQVGIGPVAHDRRVGDPRRYTARRDDQGIELVLERMPEHDAAGEPILAWRQRVTTTMPLGEPVVQTSMGPPAGVVVALRLAGGYELHVLDERGAERFSFVAVDPPGFAPSRARLQLGGAAERLLVYVRGETQAYLDELDRNDGRRLGRASFDATVLWDRFTWPPEGPPGRELGHRWPRRDGGSYVVLRRGDVLQLRAEGPEGEPLWRSTLDEEGGRWWTHAVVLQYAEHVLVVAYCAGASGAVAYGVAAEDGALRYTASPGSIGSIGHSKYGDEVALALDDEGHALVHGHESGGDYLGVLDVASGRLLGYEVWRR